MGRPVCRWFCRAGVLALLLSACDGSSNQSPDSGVRDGLTSVDEGEQDSASDSNLGLDQGASASADGDTAPPDASTSEASQADAYASDSLPPESSDGGSTQEAGLPPSTATVIVLPDTQYYTDSFAGLDIFATQTRWIVEQAASRHIAAVLHVGDVIDYGDVKEDIGQDGQWQLASAALRLLDHVVPYVLSSGNHDETNERQGLMGKYFALSTMPWLGGASAPDRVANSYAVVTVGPQQWLLLSLEFSPRDATLTWADGVLKAHATLPAMIVTHAYLYSDGTRYDYATYGANQSFYPQVYQFTPNEGMNDGEQIWQKLIVPNPNVRLVFSGHDNSLGARLTSTRPDGSKVHQMLSDFQWLNSDNEQNRGGDGYLEILEFDYLHKQIRVQTYSPYQGIFMRGDASEFTLSLEL